MMKFNYFILLFIIQILSFSNCNSKTEKKIQSHNLDNEFKTSTRDSLVSVKPIKTGAEQFNEYKEFLQNKKVALVTNQTGIVGNEHLLDFLLKKNINIVKIFSPEHGFRGNLDRGKQFDDTKDEKTGLPVVAMYGKNKKPSPDRLINTDVLIFDIQDVGVRFYSYISSMHYVMEACAENNKKLIILDRPNPLGDYVDGPVLNLKFKSFVGKHPIPIVHGLTIGELALMINAEGWLKNGIKCDLHVVKMKHYNHKSSYSLPVKPSPNLPNDISIRLYPSLCFFEATEVSIGRGTSFPFQVIGYPEKCFGEFNFIPEDMPGMQMNPIQEGNICYGVDLRDTKGKPKFTLKYLIEFYNKFPQKDKMITRSSFFNLLAGNSDLAEQIKSGMTEEQIKETWKNELSAYKKLRKKYLLYEDFE